MIEDRWKTIELKKTLGPIKKIEMVGLCFSELAALLIDEKPVVFSNFLTQDLFYIKNLCSALKLKIIFPELLYGEKNFHLKKGYLMTLIGKTKKDIALAAKIWTKKGVMSREWGERLGYPKCCVDFYLESEKKELVQSSYLNSKNKKSFYFGLNNIVNYFSRLSMKDDIDKSEKITKLNNKTGISISNFSVATWHPCSYNCVKSLKKAKKIFLFVNFYAPAYADYLKDFLSRPVLFLDNYKFAFFDGKIKNGRLHYRGLRPPHSLLSNSFLKILSKGNNLLVKKNEINISSENVLISKYKFHSPPLLLNFNLKG